VPLDELAPLFFSVPYEKYLYQDDFLVFYLTLSNWRDILWLLRTPVDYPVNQF
jgi:hypothetical protein